MKQENALIADKASKFLDGQAYALGIDVGGTKTAGAIVNLATGALAARQQFPTQCDRGGEAVLSDVEKLLHVLEAEAKIMGLTLQGVGLGVAELVSPMGQIFSDYRIAWKGLDVASRLAQRLEVHLDSDVRAAAIAEGHYGAGKQYNDFLFVTIGTGVSAVSVRDGVPYAGSRGAALVIANGVTRRRCENCGYESEQVLEKIASGPGIVALAGQSGKAEDVLAAAHAGGLNAIAAVEKSTTELGNVIALLVNSLDPAAVIVGGGLGSAPGLYWENLCRSIQAGLWDGDERLLPIHQAALGPDAGIVGAAASFAAFIKKENRGIGRKDTHERQHYGAA